MRGVAVPSMVAGVHGGLGVGFRAYVQVYRRDCYGWLVGIGISVDGFRRDDVAVRRLPRLVDFGGESALRKVEKTRQIKVQTRCRDPARALRGS